MKRSWRTCAEHPHCQEEGRGNEYDDKVNTLTVTHHREAQEHEDSPVSPERFVRAYELGRWVEKLEARAERLNDRAETISRSFAMLEGTISRLELTAVERVQALDSRAQGLDTISKRKVSARAQQLADLLKIRERLAVLEERTRPWCERMRGAR